MGVYDGEEQNKKFESLREKLLDRDKSDLAQVYSRPEGRRFIWRILSMAGVFTLSYSGEAHWNTNFNEGKRSVGTLLLKDIPPEVELTMKREAANDKLLREMEQREKSNAT